MNGRGFYHRPWRRLLCALLLAGCAAATAQEKRTAWEDQMTALPAAPPPHSVADITRLLDHYRPDPGIVEKARAQASASPPTEADRSALFRFYFSRGTAAGQIGLAGQQIADLRQAVDEYGEKGTTLMVRALRELATAESWGGNLLNGVARARQALEHIPPNMMGMELGTHQQLVAQNVALGDFDAAREHLRKAEATYTMLRRARAWDDFGPIWTSLVERSRAELFRAEGRFVEAEGAYRKALRALEEEIRIVESGRKRQGDDPQVLDRNRTYYELLERGLAVALLAQGKVAEAEATTRQALRRSLERLGRGATPTALGLNLLAAVIAEQGRSAEASLLAREALRSHEMAGAAPDSLFLANARRALASALVAQSRYAEAMATFAQMRAGLQSSPELLAKVGAGDLDWVLAMLRTGDQTGAERMAKSMYERTRQRFDEAAPRTATVRAYYAMTLAARGERAEALRHFQAAVPVLLDQSRADAEAETNTIKRQQRMVTILESYMKLLAESGGAGGAMVGAEAEEAFRIADVARGSAVQRALTASAARANIADPALAALARREQDAQRRINALSELLTQLLAAPPEQQLPKVQAKMREDIEALRGDRERARKEIAERYPDYAELVDPKPATVAQVAKSLRPGEALLAYYFGEEASLAWALKADGKVALARVEATRADIAAEVTALRAALDPGAASLEDIPAFDFGRAHRLYERLLKPLAAVWGDAKLLLVAPHAELGQLPLALLPTEAFAQPGKTAVPFAGYKGAPWLARRLAIAQLPSVTALASLRRLPPGDAKRRPFVGFGDPFFSKAQAEAAGAPLAHGVPATRGVRLRNTPHTARMDSAGLALLPRLPDTNEEIREVAKVLDADPAQDIYLQQRATLKAVMETDLTRRRVVMFSTHGLVPGDLDGLTQPALALTSPEVVPDGGDGFLTLDRVLSLKLNADWVVLSACNTAAGDGAGGEAVSGLGRAFFFAGARALLASNWPVETEAARLLMTDLFHRQRARPGLAKAEALRQAMLALADGPGLVDAKTGTVDYAYAHPLFWAPFVVVGD